MRCKFLKTGKLPILFSFPLEKTTVIKTDGGKTEIEALRWGRSSLTGSNRV